MFLPKTENSHENPSEKSSITDIELNNETDVNCDIKVEQGRFTFSNYIGQNKRQ